MKVAGLQLYLKETPTQTLSSEYCKVFKNTYFERHLQTAASNYFKKLHNKVNSSFRIDSFIKFR